jgi:hypothetical protein
MRFRIQTHHSPPPWLYPKPPLAAGDAAPERAREDARLLDALARAAFGYFVEQTNQRTGLIADAARTGSPASIAAVGFALSAYPIGVEHGWIDRPDAVQRTLRVLRFLIASDQSGAPESTGYRGFYFHFLDMESGCRVWNCELSIIDTSLLIAGVLTAASYFTRHDPGEDELRSLADALYRRVDWRWAQGGGKAVALGWKPGHGFMNYGWQGYSEALVMYALGLGSPTNPLDEESFQAWTMTYQWENIYGYDLLYAGPLFIHQLSHAWIDLRGVKDRFMREKRSDYFENSRRAAYVHREYATRNPLGFVGYGADCWGHSAGEGPTAAPIEMDGRRQPFLGYAARGAPYGPDDGTLAGSAALGSLAFAPEIVLPVVRKLAALERDVVGRHVLASGFNTTLADDEGGIWVSPDKLGFDQGLILLMIENHRSDLIWSLGRSNDYLCAGLRRAGFKGGWLSQGQSRRP